MIMSGPQRPTAEAFAVELLREDPNLDYSAIRERAKAANLSVQPIHYGRARRQLGLPALRDSRPEPQAPDIRAAQMRVSALAPTPEERDEPASDGSVDESADESEPVDDFRGPMTSPASLPATASSMDDIAAPRRKGSPAFDYLLQQLRNEPNLLYAPLRDRCATQGFKIAPIMYGRAKAVLGLVPVKPRGKKAALATTRMPTPGVPMQFKQVESVAADRFSKKLEEVRNIEQLVAIVKDLDAERRRLRDVLERAVAMIDDALGPV